MNKKAFYFNYNFAHASRPIHWILRLSLKEISFVFITILYFSCTSQVKEDPVISKKYSVIQKTYFFETATEEKYDFVIKWKKPVITYSINGVFNKEEIDFINKMMVNLPVIDNFPEFRYTKNDGDIIFEMPLNAEAVKGRDAVEKVRGTMIPLHQTYDGYYDAVKILIKPGQSLLETQITIQHEFVHAIGLSGHPKTITNHISSALGQRYFNFLVGPIDHISYKLPVLDSVALSILYNKAVKVRMHKRQIATLIGLKK